MGLPLKRRSELFLFDQLLQAALDQRQPSPALVDAVQRLLTMRVSYLRDVSRDTGLL